MPVGIMLTVVPIERGFIMDENLGSGVTPPAPPAPPVAPPTGPLSGPKDKMVAGILAILLGSLGIHKFYLGYTKEAVIMLVVTLVTFGFGAAVMQVVGIIEGIMYLTKTDEEFQATYVASQKTWF